MALTESMITGPGKTKAERVEIVNEMSDLEKRAGIQATARMVRYICVEPQLVIGEVGDRKNAISVELLTQEDFGALVDWAQSGGGEAPGLKTFRRKRK